MPSLKILKTPYVKLNFNNLDPVLKRTIAVAIAFTVLNAANFGITGIGVATIGVSAIFGMGLFVASACKNREKTAQPLLPGNHATL